ncbi:MAG: hypothetical protein GXO04_03410, partial [Aquificae bacterium]|nr:hypothetical protein [Aquificota bacterium]
MLLDRYILRSYLVVFLLTAGVSVLLVSLYTLLDFLLGFKQREVSVALEYFFLLLPVGFYYLSFGIVSVSLFVFMRRVTEKKIDLTAQ